MLRDQIWTIEMEWRGKKLDHLLGTVHFLNDEGGGGAGGIRLIAPIEHDEPPSS